MLYQSCGTGKQSIRQFVNWLMHSPPGCADMIQVSSILTNKKIQTAKRLSVFLVRERRLEPAVRGGPPRVETCPRHVSKSPREFKSPDIKNNSPSDWMSCYFGAREET